MEKNLIDEEKYQLLINEIKLMINENLYNKGAITEEIYKDAKNYIISA